MAVRPYYLFPCTGNTGGGSDCFGSSIYGEVLAILRELAHTYTGTLCFPAADNDCDGELTTFDAMVILLSYESLYILRACDFYAPP